MNQYCDWYKFSLHKQVRFAKMKLVRAAQLYWESVEQQLESRYERPISSCVEMRDKLKEKYVPRQYQPRLLEQYHAVRQGSSSIMDYIMRFDES